MTFFNKLKCKHLQAYIVCHYNEYDKSVVDL